MYVYGYKDIGVYVQKHEKGFALFGSYEVLQNQDRI